MAGELSDGNHVGRFLELDRLLVDELALVVHDDVGVQRAVLGSVRSLLTVGLPVSNASRLGERERGRTSRSDEGGRSR